MKVSLATGVPSGGFDPSLAPCNLTVAVVHSIGEVGRIDSTFGKGGKFKVVFDTKLPLEGAVALAFCWSQSDGAMCAGAEGESKGESKNDGKGESKSGEGKDSGAGGAGAGSAAAAAEDDAGEDDAGEDATAASGESRFLSSALLIVVVRFVQDRAGARARANRCAESEPSGVCSVLALSVWRVTLTTGFSCGSRSTCMRTRRKWCSRDVT